MNLKNGVAIVTGSSSGVGAATAKLLAERGCRVVISKQDFFDIYGVNVVGPYQMTLAAEKALCKSGDGAVVNVSSRAGVKGAGSSIAYAASKGALITMTMSLARVLGPEVRVNCVCPGFIAGEWLKEGMGEQNYARVKQERETSNPLKRVCTPESVAESILGFIDGHSIVTGEHIMLDGGQHLM